VGRAGGTAPRAPGAASRRDGADGGDEDEEELRDRYRELLEELRTVSPGVSVLLAFLLTAPFGQRFTAVDDLGRDVYAGAVLGVALAVVLFWTPAAYHRLGERRDRSARLRVSVGLAIAGMALVAVSLSAVLFVVVRFVFDDTLVGVVFGAVPLALVVVLWIGLPRLHGAARSERRDG
jgi:hypothetical protein